jgi:ubiquinol-cytochrome c reductase iron-sulfur subunit
MADEVVNQGRRRFLTAGAVVVGLGGLGTLVEPFVNSWMPSARSKAAGAQVVADISKVKKGQMITVGWQGVPVCIINRTKAQVATLSEKIVTDRLRDPNSDHTSQQPAYCKNTTRSIKPDWLVMILICTHLGCVPDYVPKIGPEPYDPNWRSGFFCPCHHSRYDVAGRVYDGVPAPLNMVVPPYHYMDDTHVQIGVNPDENNKETA